MLHLPYYILTQSSPSLLQEDCAVATLHPHPIPTPFLLWAGAFPTPPPQSPPHSNYTTVHHSPNPHPIPILHLLRDGALSTLHPHPIPIPLLLRDDALFFTAGVYNDTCSVDIDCYPAGPSAQCIGGHCLCSAEYYYEGNNICIRSKYSKKSHNILHAGGKSYFSIWVYSGAADSSNSPKQCIQ